MKFIDEFLEAPLQTGKKYIGRVKEIPRAIKERPIEAAAIGAGILGGDYLIGQPLAGTVDAVSLGLTNLKPNERERAIVPVEVDPIGYEQAPSPIQPLNAQDLKRQIDYYQKRIATDMTTLNALQQQYEGTRR